MKIISLVGTGIFLLEIYIMTRAGWTDIILTKSKFYTVVECILYQALSKKVESNFDSWSNNEKSYLSSAWFI